MTTKEAREIYLKSDCSYFVMCTNYYSSYIEYKKLGLPTDLENTWKNEKMVKLGVDIRRSGDYRLFQKICEIAEDFRDYEKLRMVLEALRSIREPLETRQRISVAETILGRRHPKVRGGLIYWAYDIGQKGIAILLMDQVLEYLFLPNAGDADLIKRVRKGQRLCKKIIADLDLHFSSRYLKHYYNF